MNIKRFLLALTVTFSISASASASEKSDSLAGKVSALVDPVHEKVLAISNHAMDVYKADGLTLEELKFLHENLVQMSRKWTDSTTATCVVGEIEGSAVLSCIQKKAQEFIKELEKFEVQALGGE